MREALVLCGADPVTDPRPNRMIRALSRDHRVTVLCRGRAPLSEVECLEIPRHPRKNFPQKLLGVIRMRLGRLRPTLWPPGLPSLASRLRRRRFDLVVVHDLLLLPVSLAIAGLHARVVFDAREYYPRQYEDRLWWRLMFQPLNYTLCRRYLRRASAVVTVSPGLAEEFKREFGVDCHLMPSLPAPRELSPRPVDPTRIRLVHHGLASPSRQLEVMIELMDHLPERYTLDMLLMPSDQAYLARLQKLCATRPRVRILPPVPFAELVPFTHAYDIGLFLVPPVSFNLRHALPNKFFEFVQARLMVAIGPSPDMARFVRAHDLGVVADDFAPTTLAAKIAALSPDDILRHKQNAHAAAALLNSSLTDRMVHALAAGEAPPALAL
jgi:glycosyltransferase involved in cell wall biosynthesis